MVDRAPEGPEVADPLLQRSPRLGRSQPLSSRSPLRAVVGALVAVTGVGVVLLAVLAVRPDPAAISPTVVAAAGSVASASGAPSSGATSAGPASSEPSSAAAVTSGSDVPSADPAPLPPLTVLNDSRQTGLADLAATAYRAGGWSVVMVGNYTGRVAVTTVYFEPGQELSAQRLAEQFPGIVRVSARFAGLPGTGLTVVLTRDYPA